MQFALGLGFYGVILEMDAKGGYQSSLFGGRKLWGRDGALVEEVNMANAIE